MGSDDAAAGKDGAVTLRKRLGLLHVFAIASGAMISSGLFILPGMAHAMAGPGVIWSYLLAGILATAGALSIAELTTAMPKAGGDYFFIMRGFGSAVGTVAGMLSWFSLSLKSAFAIVGMATFASLLVHLHGLVAGAVLVAVFVVLNLVGVREAARAQIVLVVGLFGLLGMYIVVGIPQVRAEMLVPFAPYGLVPIFTAAGFVFVSYGGLLNVASIAEEVRRPGRTIPLGMVLSLVMVTLCYTLVVVVTSGVVESEVLDGSRTPISDGGRAILGRFGFVAMTVGAVLAFVSTANAGIMAASRYLLALSRDGLLPEPLSWVNRRFGTPHAAIGVTGAVIFLSLLLELDLLVEAASTVLLLTNILSCLSVVVLRESGLQNYRPAFKAPLYPWLQIGGILGLSFVLVEMGIEAYFISAVLILAGFMAFWFYGRRRVSQESALLHLVARLTARDLVTGTLESELKQIVHERDEVILDRFDRLVENAPVLDLREPVSAEEFFERAGEELAARLGMDPDDMVQRLRRREEEGSTLLGPHLAVPHVIVPGERRFELLLARARQGVRFSDDAPEVRAIFVLAGTRDERNAHLRALAAIAQIVQERGFLGRWMAAAGAQALRDIALLSDRRRDGATG
jgi:amino acid transporter/mannitol/fructose-specific phosphotransferase system IIA component (Ntr-type)